MTSNVTVSCDALGCNKEIDNNGTSDDVQQLIEFNNWRNDPTTDEFHYCDSCWPAVRAEYEEMNANGELDND